ncbi:MAG: hypothetical protein JNM07_02105 [Phycisphaerae bacterium]|nr:hypothetical protein [Phycisphaerae bacterium]
MDGNVVSTPFSGTQAEGLALACRDLGGRLVRASRLAAALHITQAARLASERFQEAPASDIDFNVAPDGEHAP